MHKSRLAGFIIDCRTDDVHGAARFWSEALGIKQRGILEKADRGLDGIKAGASFGEHRLAPSQSFRDRLSNGIGVFGRAIAPRSGAAMHYDGVCPGSGGCCGKNGRPGHKQGTGQRCDTSQCVCWVREHRHTSGQWDEPQAAERVSISG